MQTIQEIGSGTAKPYSKNLNYRKFTLSTSGSEIRTVTFDLDDADARASIDITYNKFFDKISVSFDVKQSPTKIPYDTTNLGIGVAMRIMATIVREVEKYANEIRKNGGKVEVLEFVTSDMKDNIIDVKSERQRTQFYMSYVKKRFPKARAERNGELIQIYLNEAKKSLQNFLS